MPQFLDKDGYINVAEFILLARDIDKLAAKEGLKPKEVYFSKKAIVKRDHPSSKKLDEVAFSKKRAQPIKMRARMPASGSRVKMMVFLRNYKDLDQYDDYWKDYQAAVKAIEAHTRKAEKVVERLKAEGAKTRAKANAEFDKNLACFTEEVLPEDAEFVIGQSMMGKTVIVKLPNGGYVSIGKSDKDKYLNAKKAADAPDPKRTAARGGKTAPAGRGKPAGRQAARPTKVVKKAAGPGKVMRKVRPAR